MIQVAIIESKLSRTDWTNRFDGAFEFDRYALCSDSTKKKVLKKDVDIDINIDDYRNSINYKKYLGFNLVLSDFKKISICSSQGKENLKKAEKIFVIGNKSFHTSSDKLTTAKKDFEEILDSNFTNDIYRIINIIYFIIIFLSSSK